MQSLSIQIRLSVLIAFAIVLIMPNGKAMAQVTNNMDLVWQDEFVGTQLDDTKWGSCPEYERQGGGSFWKAGNYQMTGTGQLRLDVTQEGNVVSCGAIRTKGLYQQKFGYFEVRCMLPEIKGGWCSFWLMPNRNVPGFEGKDGTEIDIFESINGWRGSINQALHWDGYGDEHKKDNKSMLMPELYDGGFHKFGMLWTPTEYVYYIDDKETWRTSSGGVSEVEQYLKLTLEVSVGTWAGNWADQVTKPIYWYVDYVRAYQFKPTCNTPTLTSVKGTCLDTAKLSLSGAETASQIVWQNNSAPVKTELALPAQFSTVAGGTGVGGGANKLNSPDGIFVDGSGNIYVVDKGNNRVQRWAPGATAGVTVAGGNGRGAGANQLNAPTGVFVDGSGNIFIADFANHRVQKWAPGAGSGITVAGGNGAGNAANKLQNPYGVWVDAGANVYVADGDNSRIQKWAPGAGSGTTIAGGNGAGNASNQLRYPRGVFVDGAGNIFIADGGNSRIQKWAPGAAAGVTVAGGNGFGSRADQLSDINNVFVDATGNIYTADYFNDRVQKWAPGATMGFTIAGGNGQGAAANQFAYPRQVFVDNSGYIYVSDEVNNRVQKWMPGSINSTYTPTVTGSYTAIATYSNGCSSNSSPAIVIKDCSIFTWYPDADKDGYGDPRYPITSANKPNGYVDNNLDCKDWDNTVYTGAPELADGKDNNCDGQVDEGLACRNTWYYDRDNDGYGDFAYKIFSCVKPVNYGANYGDCNYSDATIYPGAPELCDGKDNNCNGQIDEGVLTTFYRDADGDGFGTSTNSVQACTAPTGYISNNTDCNDNSALEKPGQVWYKDSDNDGYAQTDAATITQCLRPAGYKIQAELTATSGDCNDDAAAINPHADEMYDGVDNNCDGTIDEGWFMITWYRDKDGDGFGMNTVTLSAVSKPNGYAIAGNDCNDSDPNTYPGAPELGDGKDNNCDKQTDEGLACRIEWYIDSDGDGFGSTSLRKGSCIQPVGYVSNSTDCNDNSALEKPGQVWYKDNDNDGYAQTGAATITQCLRPAGYKTQAELTATSGDCNDAAAAINPGANEVCDGVDNNCNGTIDEGCIFTWYRDGDKDGFGDARYTLTSATRPNGYVDNSLDCKDWDNTVYTGAPELGDGIDNNCDGQVDEGLACRKTWYYDRDNDGYGDFAYIKFSCIKPPDYGANYGDCNYGDATIYPGAPELCDGKDNNCNGQRDEGCTLITGTAYRKPESAINQAAKVDVVPPALEISLWPNPANAVLMVSLDAFEPGKKVELLLMQADGRAAASQSMVPSVKGQQVRFDIRLLGAGYYLLHAKQGVMQQTKKVMIVR